MTSTQKKDEIGDFSMNFGPAHPGSGNFGVKVQMLGKRMLLM